MIKTTAVLFFALLASSQTFGQQLTPAPTFHLLSTGYGAAALGMGGAFVAIADDGSAIYWNPAGLSQIPDFGVYLDYRFQGDTDEDFSQTVLANRFESKQRYSLTGNRFQSVVLSDSIKTRGGYIFTPAFAYHRTSAIAPKRKLKEPAEITQEFLTSTGTFQENQDDDKEYGIALAAKVNDKVSIGGSWNVLRGKPTTTLTGNFVDTTGSDVSNIALEETRRESPSGNYFNVGILLSPKPIWRIGVAVRFPYTRQSDISLERKGTIVSNSGSGPFQFDATAKTQVDVPLEWTTGVAVRTPGVTIGASITYADWSTSQLTTLDSSNTTLLPNGTLPYPTLREGTASQMSLLQWRAGIQYSRGGRQPGLGLVVRTGIFRDSQPLGNISSNRTWFRGYSFGVGYNGQGYHFDLTFSREKGELVFRPQDTDFSTFTSHRILLSFGFSS